MVLGIDLRLRVKIQGTGTTGSSMNGIVMTPSTNTPYSVLATESLAASYLYLTRNVLVAYASQLAEG